VQDEDVPGKFCSPENPIKECIGRTLPTILYPFTEGSQPHKHRSFGLLSVAEIESSLGNISLQGASEDSEADSDSSASFPSDCLATATGSSSLDQGSDGVPSLAEKVLVKEWDRRAEQGLFRYNVQECVTKVCVCTFFLLNAPLPGT
jgi:hypothetical protein